ncbi:hypothetical protein Gotri_019634, partial [Gossypium trilobum]|nr:hypothetical protein [Gossypium trilobum]
MRYFNVMILGPTQSPYEGGVFKLELFLPEEYPMAAPKVLDFESFVKLSILAAWENMPRYSQGQMESSSADPNCTFKALLSAPNPDDPLSENIAKHWKSNEAEAVET